MSHGEHYGRLREVIGDILAQAGSIEAVGGSRADMEEIFQEERLHWFKSARLTKADISEALARGTVEPQVVDAIFNNSTWDVRARTAVEQKAYRQMAKFPSSTARSSALQILRASASAGVLNRTTEQAIWRDIRANAGGQDINRAVELCGILARLPEEYSQKSAGAMFNEMLDLVGDDHKWTLARVLGQVWGNRVAQEFAVAYLTTVASAPGSSAVYLLFGVGADLREIIIRACVALQWAGVPDDHIKYFLAQEHSLAQSDMRSDVAKLVYRAALERGILSDLAADVSGGIADVLLAGCQTEELGDLLARAKGNLHKAILGKIGSGPARPNVTSAGFGRAL